MNSDSRQETKLKRDSILNASGFLQKYFCGTGFWLVLATQVLLNGFDFESRGFRIPCIIALHKMSSLELGKVLNKILRQ